MKKITLLMIVVLSLFQVANAQTVFSEYVDGKIWFKLKSDYQYSATSIDAKTNQLPLNALPFIVALKNKYGITELKKPFAAAKNSKALQLTYQVNFTSASGILNFINDLNATGAVEYAERVPLTKNCLTPNDPSYSSQWGLSTINAAGAWNFFSAGSTVVVAVVDDAVERTHPDLSPSLWVNTGEIPSNAIDDDGNGYVDDINGFDVADNDNNPNPPSSSYSHGTHVAGIVGARTNNSVGIASIGFSVKLMCVKATNSASAVTNGYDGVVYAVASGADVINMSWGGTGSSTTAQNIISWADQQGVVLVAAAGNSNVNTQFYPAAYTEVIAVSATNSNDTKASFSNYGTWVDISAPGNNIYSTYYGGTYANNSGTSMASPFVAGLAGLMLSLNPFLTPADIRTCLTSNAVNIDPLNPSYTGQLGAGRINASASMSCVSATLAWPPSADFTVNSTTVTAGGSLTFTDLSVYNPTSWSWSFSGGTPATFNGQNPPQITYNTPGTYAVTLTASNSNGGDVETKTAYITVNAAGTCTKINLPIPGTWTLTNYYTGATVGADGWINGVNLYADKEKAMYFDASIYPSNQLVRVLIAFGRAYSSNPNKIVPIKIYDGTGGVVGALLGTTNLTMGEIMADRAGGYYSDASFVNNPITLPVSKRFFVSVDLTNLNWATSKDTLSIVSNQNGQTIPSAIWEKQSDNLWYQYTTPGSWNLSASLAVHPHLTSTPTVATFTQSALTVCQGSNISFNATGSTYEDTLLWAFDGGAPFLSNNVQQNVIFNTPGTYDAVLYVIGGGCAMLDTAFVTITVNANPTVNVSVSTDTICPGNSSSIVASGAASYVWSPSTGLSGTTGSSVTASPTSTVNYNVQGTSANGCISNSPVTIYVDQPPSAVLSASSTVICQTDTVNLDASGSSNVTNFNWLINGGTPGTAVASNVMASYPNAGNFYAKVTTTNSCGTDKDSVLITVNPLPVASVTNSSTTICLGDSVQFNASASTNVSNYNWTFSGGTPSSSNLPSLYVVYPTAGTYTATLTASNSCGNDNSYTAVVNVGCVGIDDVFSAENIHIYTFGNQLTIQAAQLNIKSSLTINLINELGQTVYNEVSITNNLNRVIDIGQLASGIYTVLVFDSEKSYFHKFVK